MAGSTYSTNLKIELMSTGENSGTWGDITNTNLGTALEQAIVGYGNPNYASDANLTISITNSNASQAARALVLNVTSSLSLTATRELVVPTIQKQYIVQNNTTGSQSITVKTSAGTGITVPNGRKAHLYVDGTNVIQMFDFINVSGGTINNTTIGATTASSGAFTSLTASGATTLNGAVALGDASGDAITVPGTISSNLLFTDNTYDIGASGATRPRNLYLAGAATIGGNLSVGGTLTLTGGLILNGNVTVGDSSADTLTVNATITSNLLFTDNTYDIGASGATRPRNLFLAGNSTIGGNETVAGTITVDSTTDSSSTTTGSIQTDGGVGIAKKLFVGNDITRSSSNSGIGNYIKVINTSNTANSGALLSIQTGGTSGGSAVVEYYNQTTAIYSGATTSFANYFVGTSADGNNPYFVANSTGLGVGTTSPSYKLDVDKGSAGLVARFKGGTRSAYIYSDNDAVYFASDTSVATAFGVNETNDFLTFYTANAERGRFSSTGNFSVGATNQQGRIGSYYAGKGSFAGLDTSAFAAGVGGTLDLGGNYRSTGDYQTFVRIAAEKNNATDGDYGYNMGFYVTTYPNSTFGTKAMTIDSLGNLFVGWTPTGSGTAKFAVRPTSTYAMWTSVGFNDGTAYGLEFGLQPGHGSYRSAIRGMPENYGGTDSGALAFYTSNSYNTGAISERVRITSAGNVCIGSTEPGNAGILNLSVGNPGTTVGGLQLWSTTSGTHYVQFGDSASGGAPYSGAVGYNHSVDALTFWTNQSEKMRLTSAGSLLLGNTTSCNWQVSSAGHVTFTTATATTDNAGDAYRAGIGWQSGTSGDAVLSALITAQTVATYSANLLFLIRNTGGGNIVERARITSAGLFGLGTNNPQTALQVNAGGPTIRLEETTTGGSKRLEMGVTTAGVAFIGANQSAQDLLFQTTGTERMRITSGGAVCIGTTSTFSNAGLVLDIGSGGTNRPIAVHGTGGVDGTYVDWLVSAPYGSNTNEINIIKSSISVNAGNSGLQFWISDGGGASTTTRSFQINRTSCTVVGSLSKGSGSFKIDHPLPEKTSTHHLVHSFIEGPQADLIYRGKVNLVNGSATINIDQAAGMTEGTFVVLCRDVQCFTTNESDWTAVRGSVSGNILTIEAQDQTCAANISWMVIGERQDKHMYDTDWTDDNGKVIVEPLKPIES